MRRPILAVTSRSSSSSSAGANAAEPRIAADVTAGGTDVSGLTLAEAAGKLYNTHSFKVGRPLSTHVAGHKYAVNPADLGFVLDVNKSARRAYNAGAEAAHRTGRRPAVHHL